MPGPLVTPVSPLKNATGVPAGSSINFTLTHAIGIVNPWTVHIERGGGLELAFTYNGAASFEPQFQGSDSVLTIVAAGKNYDLTIHPRSPFINGQVVEVTITAEDALGNPATIA